MRNNLPKIYDDASIDSLPWPATEEGEFARKFLTPLMKNGVRHYVENIDTKLSVLTIDDIVIPLTINDAEYENSYVCSPYSQYVSSGLFVISKMKNALLRKFLSFFVKLMGKGMRSGKLNKVITVNNWLFTTCPPINIDKEKAERIKEFLTKKFPDHAIFFRTIDQQTGSACYNALKAAGFDFIPSRHIYLTHGNDESVFQTRVFKSDLKFLKDSNVGIVKPHEISEPEI